jgi:hypothetical protein
LISGGGWKKSQNFRSFGGGGCNFSKKIGGGGGSAARLTPLSTTEMTSSMN